MPQNTENVLAFSSLSDNFSYFFDFCIIKKPAFDSLKKSSIELLKIELTQIVEKVFEEKLPNRIPIENNISEKQADAISMKSELADRTFH